MRIILTSLIVVSGALVYAQEATAPSLDDVIAAAVRRTRIRVTYDGSYRTIEYPGGDIPDSIGVCTDLIVRAYRAVGIDLQKEVHEDMCEAFDEYPKAWGLSKPDRNIDHRRVLNLRAFFTRHGKVLDVTRDSNDYNPGDLVTWMLPGNIPHIGMVTHERSPGGKRPLVVHNIGRGPEVEDIIFKYPITGHYRYLK